MIPSLGQGANSSFEGAYRLAAALRGAKTDEEVCAALRAYEVAQMERVHWIVERSAQQGKTVYEDRDEFMRKHQAAQDDMGAVLGWEGLTSELTASGKLVRLLPQTISSQLDFYVKLHNTSSDRAKLVFKWLGQAVDGKV